MFDKGATGGVTSLRPRLMEINVGPDLTAHPGWEDELKIHSDMMAEVAGLLGSRMQPVPGLSAVQKEMQQHVSADDAAAVTETEAAHLWQLMLEREHLRSFDRLLPPWQPPQHAGGGTLDEAEVSKRTENSVSLAVAFWAHFW